MYNADYVLKAITENLLDALYFELGFWSNCELLAELSISNAERYSDYLNPDVQTWHYKPLGNWLYSDLRTRIVR